MYSERKIECEAIGDIAVQLERAHVNVIDLEMLKYVYHELIFLIL